MGKMKLIFNITIGYLNERKYFIVVNYLDNDKI